MKTFKSISDVDRFRDHPLHATIKSLVSAIIADYPEYRPENDGWLVLLEPGDVDRVLDDLDMPYKLSEVPFEGVTKVDGCFLAVWLPNNQFGLDFLIPDGDWMPGDETASGSAFGPITFADKAVPYMNNHAHHSVGFFKEDYKWITFKSHTDLQQLNRDDPAFPAITYIKEPRLRR